MSDQQPIDKPANLDSFYSEFEGVNEQPEPQQPSEPQATATAEEGADLPKAETQPTQGEQTELGESEQENSKREIPDKENPESYKYWQSLAQKYESKFGVKPDDVTEAEAELFKTFRSHPDALNETVQYFSGKQQQAQQPQGNSKPESQELEPPKKPERPADYNPYEVGDPSSSSYKYEQEFKKYLEDSLVYEQAQRKQLQDSIQQDKQQLEQQQQAQQQRQAIKQTAMAERGYDEAQAEKFVEFVERAQSGTFQPDEVFALYEGFSGIKQNQQQDAIQQREQELKKQRNLMEKHGALSPGAAGGAGNPQAKADTKDSFFQEV